IGKKLKILAFNYCLYDGELYRKWHDGLLLRCLGFEEVMQVMLEVHEGTCGEHQSNLKMHWLIRRHGCFWPTITPIVLSMQRVVGPVRGTVIFKMFLQPNFIPL
ncbi:hypothetical protein CFOL_v3_09468, partial [Cephalotus follicularis]